MLQPTPTAERWLELTRRLGRSPRESPFSERLEGWRAANLPSRCTFFVLGIIAAGMIWIITKGLGQTAGLAIAGLVCVAIGEWLIVGRRQFWSGTEEALEVAGLILLALACVNDGTRRPDWFFCVVFAIAGLRLLNPLFTTLSVLTLVLAVGALPMASGFVCYGIGLAALLAGRHRFRRPAHDRMLDWLVVVAPVAGYLWSASQGSLVVAADYRHAAPSAWIVPLCPAILAVVALATGVWRRAHAPLMASMLCVACTGYELRRLTGLSLEIRLLVWGCLLLVASNILERYLLEPRRGITSRPLRAQGHSAGILGVLGSALRTPHSPPKGERPFEGDGGRFGGGGATGRY